jgi:glutathione S-transferase
MKKNSIEVWGYNTYRPFRVYWILYEYQLAFIKHKIGSRTGETQTKEYLTFNPKGKIPTLKHNNKYITESAAAVSYITYNFKKPDDFYIPKIAEDKAKVEEWCYFSLMELDCLVIYTLRKHELPKNKGLSNLYGEAPNALNAARNHFDKMIKSCEKDVPKNGWLFGESPSIADIMFVSTLIPCSKFNINIKSDKVNNYLQRAKNRKHYNNAYNDCFNI